MNQKRLAPSGALGRTIHSWQYGGSPVFVAGNPTSEFSSGLGSFPISPAGQATGFTILLRGQSIRENCLVTGIEMYVFYINAPGGQTWKFQLFRWNQTLSAYQCVASTPFSLAGSGDINANLSATFSSPVLAQEGDIIGLFLPLKCAILAGLFYLNPPSTGKYLPRTGALASTAALNIGDSNAFAQTTTDLWSSGSVTDYAWAQINVVGHRPYAVFLGDSIVSTGNHTYPTEITGERWNTDQESWDGYHTPGGSPGNINFSIPYRLSTRMPHNFTYQQFSQSGAKFNQMVALQSIRAMAADPKVVVVHCGINDIAIPRTWIDIAGDLDTLRGQIGSGRDVYLDEVLPCNNWSDALSVVIRAMNVHYAAYCALYGWTLVKCHDEMAQIRGSTGLLDNLVTAYSSDGLHLTLAGVDKMAEIIHRYIGGKPAAANLYFTYSVTVTAGQATTPKFTFGAGAPAAVVNWGDGTAQSAVTSGTELTHTYTVGRTYTVRLISANQDVYLTRIEITSDHVVSILIPTNCFHALLTFDLSGNTAWSQDIGEWFLPSLMTNFRITHSICTGDISWWTLPADLQHLYIDQTHVSGSLAGWVIPAQMENFWASSTWMSGCPILTSMRDITWLIAYALGAGSSQATVDLYLSRCVAQEASTTYATPHLHLGGIGDSPPSTAGLADKATLVAAGWVVTTN